MSMIRVYPCIFRVTLKILSGQSVPAIDETVKHNRLTSLNAPDICQKYGEYDWEEECLALFDREQVNAVVSELRDAGFEPEVVEGDSPAPDLTGVEQEVTQRLKALSFFAGLHNFHLYDFPVKFDWEIEAMEEMRCLLEKRLLH
jgi:hypothetical protein